MSSNTDVLVEEGRLAGEGKAYALATVVRVVRPASARAGGHAQTQFAVCLVRRRLRDRSGVDP